MKKLVQGAGIRPWHGNDILLAQSEGLYAIERLLTPGGACVLEGCTVSAGVGATVNISAGTLFLKHPVDGWQVVKFSAVVNQTVAGYIKWSKSVTNKTFQLNGSQPAYADYTASYFVGVPGGLSAGEFITVANNTDQLKTFAAALGASARAGWTTVFSGSFTGSAPGSYLIEMQLDKLSKMLHIRGFFIIAAGSGYAFTNIASVPAEFIPPVTSHIPCTAGGGDFTAAGAQPVLYLVLASGGNLSLQLIKPTVSDMPYQINYSLYIG